MTLQEAIDLIRPGVVPASGTWADIGAGTGLFTEALMEILTEGKIIALDKSPHSLFKSKIQNRKSKIKVEIIEADFNLPMNLPPLEGVLMANSLHYALDRRSDDAKRTKLDDHAVVLKNVLASLKPGGTFLLIEYETNKPNPPWVPNPVPFERFKELCLLTGLDEPLIIGKHESIYSDGYMYVAKTSITN